MIQVQVYRYNPETDNEPWMETREVEDDFRQRMVLDVLEHLKTRDASLAYRRSGGRLWLRWHLMARMPSPV